MYEQASSRGECTRVNVKGLMLLFTVTPSERRHAVLVAASARAVHNLLRDETLLYASCACDLISVRFLHATPLV